MPNGESVDRALTVLLAGCALAVTGMVARREFFPASITAAPAPTHVKNWRTYAVGAKRIGPQSAPVTIVEFSDFQCPFCSQFAAMVDSVLARRPADVGLVFRSFPIEQLHPHARSAAIAAECAATFDRFAEYHEFLFSHQDSIGKIPWQDVAVRSGIADTVAFNDCLDSSDAASRLETDIQAARDLDVTGTPTVMINGWRVVGVPTKKMLDELIGRELGRPKSD